MASAAYKQQGPGKLAAFDPPAFLDDLLPENRAGWSAVISSYCDSAQAGKTNDPFDHPRPQFFNSTKTNVGEDVLTKEIAWTAFPRRVSLMVNSDEKRWKKADTDRQLQDEYCEWSVSRNAEGKITRVMFTCEGPEYWEYLAGVQPDTVLQLYQQHVSPEVKAEDLFVSGKYLSINKWNQDVKSGAMHLIQSNNTLAAEIELAGGSSVVRLDADGKYIEDDQDLIECGAYGAKTRFSDPSIGAAVNSLTRAGWLVTLENPIALYFHSFKPLNFNTPDGTDASEFWTWTRGTPGRYLRGVFEVPADKGYVVGDITITGRATEGIRYGAVLADYIMIKLTGLVCNKNKKNIKPVQGCVGSAAATSTKSVNLAASSANSRML